MASQLSGYCNFIDIRNKEGQSLVSNAVNKFISPLAGDDHVQLLGKDFQKLKDNLLQLGSCYGYNYLIKHCAMVWTVIPEIVADPAAVSPVAGILEEFFFNSSINMLKHYSDKNMELACKHAALTWGECSFTFMVSNTIVPLTVVNGGLACAGTLMDDGKELILEQMHSKFLGHHIMELLTQPVKQSNSTAIFTHGSVRMDAKKRWIA
jgi:hypothetical protein